MKVPDLSFFMEQWAPARPAGKSRWHASFPAMAPGQLPFHLVGNFAPVQHETTAADLPVRGAIPEQLQGRYLRTGPNPKSGLSPHWFLGDGMVHGVELGGGRVSWYRNRYVQTRMLADPEAKRIDAMGNVDRTLSQAG